MRTYNDAIRCSQEIAQKDTAVDHYKNYIKVLVRSLKVNSMMIDSRGKVLSTTEPASGQTFSLLKFAQSKHTQYRLNDVQNI